jgi:hypothetical protein
MVAAYLMNNSRAFAIATRRLTEVTGTYQRLLQEEWSHYIPQSVLCMSHVLNHALQDTY